MPNVLEKPHTASLLMIYEDILSPYYKHNVRIALNIYIHATAKNGNFYSPVQAADNRKNQLQLFAEKRQ